MLNFVYFLPLHEYMQKNGEKCVFLCTFVPVNKIPYYIYKNG